MKKIYANPLLQFGSLDKDITIENDTKSLSNVALHEDTWNLLERGREREREGERGREREREGERGRGREREREGERGREREREGERGREREREGVSINWGSSK